MGMKDEFCRYACILRKQQAALQVSRRGLFHGEPSFSLTVNLICVAKAGLPTKCENVCLGCSHPMVNLRCGWVGPRGFY